MNRAVVCIVGRPNVGKSTLFNKIVGKRIAITEDTPGVTRDRIYAEGEWLGKYFTVIDTGGLEPDNEEIIMKNIKRQAEIAIDTADVILFVVDGLEGLNDTDKEIGNMLRKSGKNVIVACNKIDNANFKNQVYEFYELGLGEPMIISGEQGLGIGDLLDEIVKYFPKDKDTDYDEDLIKVSLIGKPNVGKSSLINNILGEDRVIVTNIPGTTRDAIDTYFNYGDNRYVFIDTAGLRRKRSIYEEVERYSVIRTLTAVDRSDICILVIDATEGVTEQDTKIAGYAHDNGKAIIIAINKWDLVKKDTNTHLEFEKEIRRVLGFIAYAPIVFISALTGQRVDKLLELINVVNNNYNLRISTGVLNDIINEAVLMNQPPSDKGKRAKIYYGTQVSVRPPKFLIFVNYKELMHFSYVRYLENQIRNHFGFIGTPIQFEFKQKGEK
ncbi:ribosome biogenesis GTPase Der [Tissierella praeacuta]|uniref:GTPase Der n=1 Tax=Tissierella praeacuta DSM 18095 TaxID=1123404 RepID=A0A1M4ZRA0_9FIRM|nr:ribosome biogenesis GTPase Der [Tissierella praeacuta]HAE91726.1 ribosome biogenesis GTPase Der [Tissierella sp.]MBU5254581.1 ribosome biogenesis GTPase Der [Tissierella praeacuta]TCU64704.1 GTP-binding protein [Tissierella praeacuta]SHF20337.1 GTP-binding protein [Tissierella praeacuta DSM 18095]SUP01889.1 GTP-binding protein EngA [Tissierella praeacuta]